MPQYKKILFPIDFSNFATEAFETAEYLAREYKADIFLLHVLEPPTGVGRLFAEYDEEKARKKANQMLEDFITVQRDQDIVYHKMIKVGKPHMKITEATAEIGANFVVMATHGASGVKEYLVGSTASRVIRSASCPVLTIRHKPDHLDFRRILLPLDLSVETREKVAYGIEMASHFNSELVIMSVLMTSDPDVHKKLQAQLDKAEQYIRSQGVKVTCQLVVSNDAIADVVVDYSKRVDADLICIMTQQELKLKEQFLGSNAEHIVNHSEIPVLSIKPVKLYQRNTYESAMFS